MNIIFCVAFGGYYWYIVIMILIVDPLGRPTVTAGSDHCFHTCCPYVRPHFSISIKTKQIISENNVHYWQDCVSDRVDH